MKGKMRTVVGRGTDVGPSSLWGKEPYLRGGGRASSRKQGLELQANFGVCARSRPLGTGVDGETNPRHR